MATRDPIRSVDARKLRTADLNRVARAVRSDLMAMRRALIQQFGEDFDPGEFEIPTQEMAVGFASNVRAWLDNETRRVRETVVDLTSGAASKSEVLRWAQGLEFRSGTLDLSVASHQRAIQRAAVLNFATAAGIENMMMVVPRQREQDIHPGGQIAKYVGRILPIARWQQISRALNRDRQGLSLIFTLGLHHGDFHQMVPVTTASLAAATEAAAQYRRRIQASLRRGRRPR